MKQLPAAIQAMFPYVSCTKYFVEDKLAHQWYSLWSSSNVSYARLAEIYSNQLADDFYRRCDAALSRNSADWVPYAMRCKSKVPGQKTLESFGFTSAEHPSVHVIMQMLQAEKLPDVYIGPSDDFVKEVIHFEAQRLQPLQDCAMEAQLSKKVMCGDHSFKLSGSCVSEQSHPFHALHAIFGDCGVLLSAVFTKDESIAALEKQHVALAVRFKAKGTPCPQIYTVDKCCQFRAIQKHFIYDPVEIRTAIKYYTIEHPSASQADIDDFSATLGRVIKMKQDVLHLVLRMKRCFAGGRATPYQKAFFLLYREQFWSPVDAKDTHLSCAYNHSDATFLRLTFSRIA